MATQIFVNLAVNDLKKSIEFYAKLGWPHNPQFTDDNAASIVISDDICLMIVAEHFFAENVSKKPRVDAHTATEAVVALSLDSKSKVDELADAALSNGGATTSDPTVESFMYGRGFADPDGHQFELFHMFGTPE